MTLLELTEHEAAKAAATIYKDVASITPAEKLLVQVVIRTAIADALIQALEKINTPKQNATL